MRPSTLAVAILAAAALGCEEKTAPSPAPRATTPPAATGAPTPSTGAHTPAPAAGGETVAVVGLTFAVPQGWKQTPPANQMRAAELHIPDASGEPAKECLVVFSTAGGDVQQNITRWAGQVTDPAGAPTKPETSERTVGGHKVTTAQLTGNYVGMGDAPKPDWAMRGAIIETPNGLLFIKMTGPAASVKAAAPAFDAMIDGMKG